MYKTIRHRRLHAGLLFALTTAVTAAAGAAAPQPAPPPPLQQYIPPAAASGPSAPTSVGAPTVFQGAPGARNAHVRQSSRYKFALEPDRTGTDTYIVRLHDLPVATYDGNLAGFAATKGMLNRASGNAGKSSSVSAAVSAYRQHLQGQQRAILNTPQARGIKSAIRYQFTDALNAFTIDLTQQQATALATLPQVDFVQRSTNRPLQTDRGPQFIGADQVWTGNTFPGGNYMGEGIVVGVLDTGINTDHPSFSATGGDGYTVQNPLGSGNYLGDCVATSSLCNDKLIGVYSWPVITGSYKGVRPANGRDYNGHGSHTASTAAGNVELNVPYVGPTPGTGVGHGIPSGFTFSQVSGVAPHANIIAYQGCFPDNRGCPDEAILLATEQAIHDGIVSVINFSIGGSERYPWNDPIALAFLSAREAGIAVAAAAGNNGPNFYTLSHSAPWYMQVAAETDDRVLSLGKLGFALNNDGSTSGVPPSTTSWTSGGISPNSITQGDLVLPSAMTPALDPYCQTPFAAGTFLPTQIVVCKRGYVTNVAKALNAQAGGAGGVIIANNGNYPPAGVPKDPDDLSSTDVYPIPGIQLRSSNGTALINWINNPATPVHQASITGNAITRTLDPTKGSILAPFSSRGPSSTYLGSLSPNITAPGVNIFAAYADEHPFDDPSVASSQDWAVLSGTSMATPHVAGTMALVRQAHPDWTPAEVQSALQMTAKDIVQFSPFGNTLYPAGIYRAGTGQLDAQAAVNAGLVMDETGNDFQTADPNNGGDVRQLNLPQLVNTFCQGVCSWVRTVRATRDGTWTASADPSWIFQEGGDPTRVFTENRVKFSVSPSTFTLQAGQTQTLLVQADVTDVQYRYSGDGTSNAHQVELWNKLTFAPSDPAIPAAAWPISINFSHGLLPTYLDLTAHRDLGGYRVQNVQLPALNAVSYRTFGLTKANTEVLTLPEDNDHKPWYTNGGTTDPSVALRWINVPAGSSRLVAEAINKLSTTADISQFQQGSLSIWIGLDNGDGVPDYVNETICSSVTLEELNYCDITNPDPGNYWVIFQDARGTLGDNNGTYPIESYTVATAVVPGSGNGSLSIGGPSASTGNPVNLDVNWDLSQMQMQPGDVAYGGFDVGAPNAPGSAGFVPVKLTRGIDDVTMTTSQTTAKPGDVINVNVHVRENDTGADRTFNLQSIMPSGLTVVPGSVTVNTTAQRGNLSVNGNTVTIAGTQIDSENWPRTYNVTTSDNDPLCRTPILNDGRGHVSNGGFIGLYNRFGFTPTMGGMADKNGTAAQKIDLTTFGWSGWSLYNNNAWRAYTYLMMSPQGWVDTDQYFGFDMYAQQQFPFHPAPYTESIAPLWKGAIGFSPMGSILTADTLNTPLNVNNFNPIQTTGMGVAYSTGTHDVIMEWVGAKTYHLDNTVRPATNTALDDRYDIDLLINQTPRYGDGQYELMMAYDNVNFGTQGNSIGFGSIGFSGYYGPIDSYGPYYADLGVQYAYNNLQSKLHNNLVVCYDYQGPESTQYDIAMKVRVAETAAGTTQLLRWTSHVDGMPDRNVDQTIVVNGTLKLVSIPDQQTPGNTTLTGIAVVYTDTSGTPDTISVTGAHVTAVVHGNAPGSTFDLIPDQGFYGTTQVTVTVTNQNNPSNQVSTTFTLTVGPEPSIFKDGFEGP